MSEPNPWTTPEATTFFEVEHDHAVASARSKVARWDTTKPEPLLLALKFLYDYVEELAITKA